MIDIELVQFLRPDGRQQRIRTELPDYLGEQYKRIRQCGARLMAEVLTTGEVSLCIEGPEGDFDCRVVPNGPEVPKALREMVGAFDEKAFDQWLPD